MYLPCIADGAYMQTQACLMAIFVECREYVQNIGIMVIDELQAEKQMKKQLRKAGKFYSSIMMENIGIFIFVGLLSVIFQDKGWFPNKNIYAVSQVVYETVLPLCISYAGGERLGGQRGGILSVLMLAGMMSAYESVGMLAGMLAAPIGGLLWNCMEQRIKKYARSSIQMLTMNLLLGILGGILAIGGYYLVAPLIQMAAAMITGAVHILVKYSLTGVLSLVIEPLKVFFLNNIVNHGILVPLGTQEVAESGSSVLFLLETNPGPGLGMLAALYCTKREKREEYAAAMAAEAVGGIHEVYFPIVLSSMWLLLPMALGSAAGAWCFTVLDAGIGVPVSPGSFITILIMAGRGNMAKVAVGIVLSAAVSFGGSLLVQKLGERKKEYKVPVEAMQEQLFAEEAVQEKTNEMQKPFTEQQELQKEESRMPVRKIGFICDAGVGSSAMGAALFRRKMAQTGIEGVQAEAYACDQIPEDLDLLVCQKDFLKMMPKETGDEQIFAVESLLGGEAFEELVEIIRKRNR